MSVLKNTVNVYKDIASTRVLKSTEVLYSIFTSDILELSKVIDRPDDYYMDGDEITFTIKLKNNGEKIIRNFVVKDELDSTIKPINDSLYEVNTTNGLIDQKNNLITISDITILPNEEVTISIKGLVYSDLGNKEESKEDNQEIEYFSYNKKD